MIQCKPENKLSAADIFISAVILLTAALSLILLLIFPAGAEIKITYDNQTLVFPIDVDKELTIKSNGYTLTVVIKNNSVSVTASDCPDGYCVHTPAVSRYGQSIICAPAHISIEVISEKDGNLNDGADAVAG